MITEDGKKLVLLIDGHKICWFEKSDDEFLTYNNIKSSYYKSSTDKLISIKDLDPTCLLINTDTHNLLITYFNNPNLFGEFSN